MTGHRTWTGSGSVRCIERITVKKGHRQFLDVTPRKKAA